MNFGRVLHWISTLIWDHKEHIKGVTDTALSLRRETSINSQYYNNYKLEEYHVRLEQC